MDFKCIHGKAVLYTSSKEASMGRQFYRCPKPIGSSERCSYFVWADEIPFSQDRDKLPPTPQSNPQASHSAFHEPPSTPTPLKRGLPEEDTITPSQKRLKIASEHPDFSCDSVSTLQFVRRQMQYDPGKEMPQTPQRVQSQRSFTTPAHGRSYDPDALAGPSLSQETLDGEEIKELSADYVEETVKSLGGLPAYLRKLERRKIAAEKSRDAKANKIWALEAEVERLRKREKELEDLVAALECA